MSATAFVFVVVIVMLMLVFVVIVMVMVVMMFVLVFVIVVVMMSATAFVFIVVVMMMVTVMLVLVFRFFFKLLELAGQRFAMLHCAHDLLARQLVPRSGYDGRNRVDLFYEFNGFGQLFGRAFVGMAEHYALCVFDLIVKKFAEVFHIHLAFCRVHDGGCGVDVRVFDFGGKRGAYYVAELAYAGRFDDDSVRIKLFGHFVQSFFEVADQTAADTTAIEFVDLDAAFLQKAAVHAYFAEFVFNENHFFAVIGFFYKFFYERGFACAQKARKNIDFHFIASLYIIYD